MTQLQLIGAQIDAQYARDGSYVHELQNELLDLEFVVGREHLRLNFPWGIFVLGDDMAVRMDMPDGHKMISAMVRTFNGYLIDHLICSGFKIQITSCADPKIVHTAAFVKHEGSLPHHRNTASATIEPSFQKGTKFTIRFI
jgi:hypothetical protein